MPMDMPATFQPKPTAESFLDLEGQRFGRLVVVGFAGTTGAHRYWWCRTAGKAVISGLIFALDLATKSGFACGPPGAVPRSGSIILKKPKEGRAVAFSNLVAFLAREWTHDRPALVVKEAALSLEAMKTLGMSEASVRLQYGLHTIVEAMAVRFQVPTGVNPATGNDPTDSTIRKHFLGIARLGSRDETKAAVVQRAQMLGLMPRDSDDDNRADAIAVWDWGCATLARRPGTAFALFGQKQPAAEGDGDAGN